MLHNTTYSQLVNGVFGGVLEVFEAVVHEFYATKPSRDTNDAISHILFLHDAQYDHSGTYFPIVLLGLVDCAFMTDARGPTVVGGLGVFLFTFELF